MALLAIPAPAPVSAAAPAACAKPTGVYRDETPWAQRLLNPSRAWPATTGAGVLVAVLGTGVDKANPQFRPGQVTGGSDVLGTGQPATTDCDGRGTFAAGIVAAGPHPQTTFTGVAPGATVLPVRYTQATENGAQVNPDALAAAIREAIEAKARVILVVAPALADSDALRAAVTAAVAADAVVVSPAAAEQNQGDAKSYPTTTPDVLAVGGVSVKGEASSAEVGDHLDLAAPAAGLVSTAPGAAGGPGHIWPVDDPAYAAAYVAGVAALVRSYRPRLSARQVASRLVRTALRPAATGRDPWLGWGVVDPYTAVTTELADEAGGSPAPVLAAAPVEPARTAAPDSSARRNRALLAFAALALAGLLAATAVVARHGHRRRWRPGRRHSPPPTPAAGP